MHSSTAVVQSRDAWREFPIDLAFPGFGLLLDTSDADVKAEPPAAAWVHRSAEIEDPCKASITLFRRGPRLEDSGLMAHQ